jgi:hypothetical protein
MMEEELAEFVAPKNSICGTIDMLLPIKGKIDYV